MYPRLRFSAARRFLFGAPRAPPVMGAASQFATARSFAVLLALVSPCSPLACAAVASPRAPPVMGAATDGLPSASRSPTASPRAPPVMGGPWVMLVTSLGTLASPRAPPVMGSASCVQLVESLGIAASPRAPPVMGSAACALPLISAMLAVD